MIEPETYQKLSSHSIRGAGPVDGDPEFLHSTRAERSAFLAPLYVAWSLAKEYDLNTGNITMHVDNTSSFQEGDPPRPGEGALRHLGGDYDLKQLKKLCEESLDHHNIEVEWQRVKAYQDEKENRQKDKAGKLITLT